MIAIFKKEMWTYFGNWTAWVILAAFSLVSALFLFFFENQFNFFEIGSASMQSYFILAPWLLLFIIPALSMKTFAEEQQNGTLQWLFSYPISIESIVLGKFLSVWLIGILCLLPSLSYFYTIYELGIPAGNLDIGMVMGGYVGLIFLIGAFAALGVLASCISSHQVMAYLLGVLFCFFMYFGMEQLASYKLLGGMDIVLQNLGFYYHFMAFTRGLIDTRDVFYFLLVMGVSIFLAKYFVVKKR